jgi:hypothetical protein
MFASFTLLSCCRPAPSFVICCCRYNDEEYAALFVDSSWTRDDTDEMMALAKRFDLRCYFLPLFLSRPCVLHSQLPAAFSNLFAAGLQLSQIECGVRAT